jgi:GDPmannose 4,6-dehydratase
MEKIALITGITGQDGSYLALRLLNLGYQVHGVCRTNAEPSWRHEILGITNRVVLHTASLTDRTAIETVIATCTPTEIYHLAAQSSVTESRTSPFDTFYTNSISTLVLLESVRTTHPAIKFFFASSSEIFDQTAPQPLTLHSPRLPTSPYGLSKLAGQLLVEQYRQNYGLFVVSGILFPHESPLRQPQSFIKQLIHHAKEKQPFTIATMDTKRDFGDAREYVIAMHHTLQQPEARDYLIATGQPILMETIINYIYTALGTPHDLVTLSPQSDTPYPPCVYGDIADTVTQLNWKPQHDIFTVIDDMIACDKHTALDSRNY